MAIIKKPSTVNIPTGLKNILNQSRQAISTTKKAVTPKPTSGKKMKIKEIINANAAEPWNALAGKFIAGSRNKTIAQEKTLASVMAIFGTAMNIYSGVLTALKIAEMAIPLINFTVKVVGCITNPTLIASIIQDLAVMVGKMSLLFMNAGIMALKDFILNYEFYFPDVSAEQILAVKDKIDKKKKDIRGKYKDLLKEIDTSQVIADNERIETLKDDLNENFSDLDSAINAHLAALIHTTETPAEWRNTILASALTDLTTSDLPTGIETTDDEIYEYITTEIKSLLDNIEGYQRAGMESVTVDVSDEMTDVSTQGKASMKKLADIFTQMAKESEIFYKKQVLEQTAYKENPDIVMLINAFKDRMATEIQKKKKHYYDDMKKAVLLSDDIETIRANAIAIVFEEIEWYHIFNISVMEAVKTNLIQNNDAADLYDEENTLNLPYMNSAANLFNNSIPGISELIIANNLPIKGEDLEDGQIIVNGLTTICPDTIADLIAFTTAQATFNLPAINNETTTYVSEYVLTPQIVSFAAPKDLCSKLNNIKYTLFYNLQSFLKYEIVDAYFNHFPIKQTFTTAEEQEMVRNYVIDAASIYAKSILDIADECINKGTVPCRNCITCNGLEVSIIAEMTINKIPSFKSALKKFIIAQLELLPYTGVSATDKALVLAYLNDPATLASFLTVQETYLSNEVYNSMLENIFKVQQLMMIDAINQQLKVI